VPVRIGYHHHRLRGVAHDLSRTGVGVRMTLVQAAVFKTGERVELRVDLPNARSPLEVGAHVRHGYRLGEDVVLGMEFDDEAAPMKPDQRKAFLTYLAEREQRTLALQRKLARGA
jgi:hypothetical protein